jgi:hypothetical protein
MEIEFMTIRDCYFCSFAHYDKNEDLDCDPPMGQCLLEQNNVPDDYSRPDGITAGDLKKQQAALDWLSSRNVKVCGNCGNVGNDVHDWLAWIGGKGYVSVTECDDLAGCWQRWDRKYK